MKNMIQSPLEETKAFIAENMEPGDVVVYDTDWRFGQLFRCYMRTRSFIPWKSAGPGRIGWKKSLVFPMFRTSAGESDKYTVTYENMGHYGFSIWTEIRI